MKFSNVCPSRSCTLVNLTASQKRMRFFIIYAATVLAVLEGVDKGRKCKERLTVILNIFLLGGGGGGKDNDDGEEGVIPNYDRTFAC